MIVTDTATLVVFDLEALRHRVDDDPDWWCDVDEEIKELHRGNAMFVALGADGLYELDIVEGVPESVTHCVTARIRVPSGKLFVGPGEDVTGGGLRPDKRRTTGRFLDLEAGRYQVSVFRTKHPLLGISIQPTQEEPHNTFSQPLSISALDGTGNGSTVDGEPYDAGYPVDLIVGGSPDQQLQMTPRLVNRSVGAQLKAAVDSQGLRPGDPISEIRLEE